MIYVLRKISDLLADAALLEMGVGVVSPPVKTKPALSETLEEHFVEIAFAEAAEYDQIHKAILSKHKEDDKARINGCRYGDKLSCFAH